MRVLVICEYASLNGGERSLLEVARRIDAPEMHVVIAAPSDGPLAEALRAHRLEHTPLDLTDQNGVRLPAEQIEKRVLECVAVTDPNLVHANSLSMARLVGRLAGQIRPPTVGHLRDIMRVSKASIRDLNQHTVLLAVSEATRNWYVTLGLAPEKTQVLHNGVDLERFKPRRQQAHLRQQLGIPTDAPLVGSIGQLGMRKGVDTLVEAAKQIAGHDPHVQFVYIGQRYSGKRESLDFEQRVRAAAATGDLRGRFHFLGCRDDVHTILNELVVYVHAARQEPLGRVLLEAGAAGTAIVATDTGGTLEIYPEELHAIRLVPPDNPSALAAQVKQLLDSPRERAAIGARARRRIAACFGAEGASHALAAWYRKLGS